MSTTPIPAERLRVIGEGRPLEPGIRRTLEAFFEADFSGVRVHEGPAAQSVGALAFTLGEALHFAPGLYDPTSREGVELLGHELTHVVQQRDGRVENPYGHGVAIVQDPRLEAEADAMGRRVAEEIWAGVGQAAMRAGRHVAGPGATGATVQLLKDLPPGTYVEVREGGRSWHGYIQSTEGNFYDIILGGTSEGYGYKDPDGLSKIVHRDKVFLHSAYKSMLEIQQDDDNELSEKALRFLDERGKRIFEKRSIVLKGREYRRMMEKSVKCKWTNITNKDRTGWDVLFKEYTSELGDEYLPLDHAIMDLRHGIGTTTVVWEKFMVGLKELFTTFENFEKFVTENRFKAWTDDPRLAKTSFRISWKGTIIQNTQRRSYNEQLGESRMGEWQKYGEYTGNYCLGEGWINAEGSYRYKDSLQQNEIFYRIWSKAHESLGRDVQIPEQRLPLRFIKRNHVVNETSQYVFEFILTKSATYKPGCDEYDMMLTIPNVRAALFLIKDRGKELGISKIERLVYKSPDIWIYFD